MIAVRFLALALGMAPLATVGTEVNTASQAQLESVKGIGPGLSNTILDQRRKQPFADWADFMARVPGVGPGSAARLSAAGLTVGGAAMPRRAASAPFTSRAASAPAAR